MRSARCSLLVVLVVLWLGPTSGQDRGLDLPVERPSRKPVPLLKCPDPPEAPPPEDRDEDLPKFCGVEVKSSNRTVCYVIDVSGSMADDVAAYVAVDGATRRGNRLDRAKAALAASIATLPGDFAFGVLAYDCSAYQWKTGLVRADTQNKADAVAWASQLWPGGGTGTGDATALGLATGARLVVLLSDGAPNCWLLDVCGSAPIAEVHRRRIRVANVDRAEVDTFGIGCAGEFRDFMVGVASDNWGVYTDVR